MLSLNHTEDVGFLSSTPRRFSLLLLPRMVYSFVYGCHIPTKDAAKCLVFVPSSIVQKYALWDFMNVPWHSIAHNLIPEQFDENNSKPENVTNIDPLKQYLEEIEINGFQLGCGTHENKKFAVLFIIYCNMSVPWITIILRIFKIGANRINKNVN